MCAEGIYYSILVIPKSDRRKDFFHRIPNPVYQPLNQTGCLTFQQIFDLNYEPRIPLIVSAMFTKLLLLNIQTANISSPLIVRWKAVCRDKCNPVPAGKGKPVQLLVNNNPLWSCLHILTYETYLAPQKKFSSFLIKHSSKIIIFFCFWGSSVWFVWSEMNEYTYYCGTELLRASLVD